MALSEMDRALRRVTAWGLIWALAFLIPFGVRTHHPLPPLLLVPQGLSFMSALYHLSGKATCRSLNIAIDAGLAVFLLVMLIIANVSIQRAWSWDAIRMVGTYGCVPAIINIGIHGYFVLREGLILYALSFIFGNMISSPTCPHCQRETLYSWRVGGSSTPTSSQPASKESYVSVRHSEDGDEAHASSSKIQITEAYKDPRPSTDDESARLV